jgi:pimeloyl-ACP methyl ester carboxylesterase
MSSINFEAEKRVVEKRFDTGEVVLNYAEGPDNGPPFIILPGYYNGWQSYKSLIPTLEAQYHLFMVDARGRGKSGRTSGRYKLRHLVDDTVAFLKQIVGEPSVLFGHSLGGWLSLWTANKKPEFVKAIIIGDSSLNLRRLKEIVATEEWRRDLKNESEWSGKPYNDLIKIFKERNPDTDMDQIMLWAETFSSVDPELSYYLSESGLDELLEGFSVKDILEKLSTPLLVLQANPKMGMINHEDVEWATSVKPDLSHIYLEELGHWLGLQKGREKIILESIQSFLSKL